MSAVPTNASNILNESRMELYRQYVSDDRLVRMFKTFTYCDATIPTMIVLLANIRELRFFWFGSTTCHSVTRRVTLYWLAA